MNPKTIHLILLIITILFIFLGFKTLLPNAGASKPCLWGYKAACSFTPVSTFILFGIGIMTYYFRVRMMNAAGLKRITWFMAISSILLITGIVYYSIQYSTGKAGDKKPKTDTVSSSGQNTRIQKNNS